MKTSTQHFCFSQKVMVLAILAAFGPVHAEDDVAEFTKPESSVSVGVAGVSGDSKDRALFGQYNGMRKDDAYGLVDVDVVRRNDATGTWTTLQGRDLGLDTRELRFGQEKQGDWKYSLEYGELVRNYQNTINTGMIGAGTTTPRVVSLSAPGTGSDLDLQTKRKSVNLELEKWISPNLQFQANFKNEDKDGARLFGRGFNCSASFGCVTSGTSTNAMGAILLLPEPINSTTRQVETKLNFSGEKFLVSAAYYGSFYDNANGSVNPTFSGLLYNPNGSTFNPAVVGGNNLASSTNLMGAPLALPPDNQAHQFSLSGNYLFTPTTRATFKYAYTHATQNEDFASMGLTGAPAGVTNLGGRMDTTLAQVGVTSSPISKLSLLANVRYEDRDNKTPIGAYSPTAGVTNSQDGLKKLEGKLEASYMLGHGYRGTLGMDYEDVDFGRLAATASPGGYNLMREKTHETSYRAELRRSMSETLTGAVSYIHSKRDGSDWLKAAIGTPTLTDAQAALEGSGRPVTPAQFMDRTRDKVKVSADWSPVERLSLQFILEDGKDSYDSPHQSLFKGLGETGSKFYGIDASLALTDVWKLTGYWNQSEQSMNVNHSLYVAQLNSRSTDIGLGLTGQLSSKMAVGGSLSYADDDNRYKQGTFGTVSAANQAILNQGGLPDTNYRATTLKLFGTYALNKASAMRMDLIHQRAKWNDWAWGYAGVPFFYSDNTTVSGQQTQNVSYIGVSYIYKFQ